MSVTNDTLALLKGAYREQNALRKAGNTVTTATGLLAFDLQAPAKNLYPLINLLGKRIARRPGKGGTATNWRQVNSIIGSGFDNIGWVPEGQRAGVMSLNASTKAASYATIGEEGALTFEAYMGAEGFEDERSRTSIRTLQKALLKEEIAILGGNASQVLGTPATPALSAAGSGATLPAATYSVIVVGLTVEGYLNSSVANGVALTKTVTGQDGQTFALNGGSSNKSVNATQAVTLGQTLTATATPMAASVAYAWFVGVAGSEILQAITTVPTASFSAPLASGTQAATAVTADHSNNPNTGFDGLLTNVFNPANGAYSVDLLGAAFTASSRGTVNEIDAMLESMWNNYRLSPTVIYVSAQEQKSITNVALNQSAGNLLRQNTAIGADGKVTAGVVVGHYYNPFALGGGVMIPVELHPNIPPGTLICWAENLPAQYQSNEVPNVAEMHVQQEWQDINWPLVTRSYQNGIYVREVLAVYAPFAMGVIKGIKAS